MMSSDATQTKVMKGMATDHVLQLGKFVVTPAPPSSTSTQVRFEARMS
jgi:hypothetical protein